MKTETYDENKWQLVPKELTAAMDTMFVCGIAMHATLNPTSSLFDRSKKGYAELLKAAPHHGETP